MRYNPLETIALYGKPVERNVQDWRRVKTIEQPGIRSVVPDFERDLPLHTYGKWWDELEPCCVGVEDFAVLHALRRKADSLLQSLGHTFPADHRVRVAFNVNRTTLFHKDENSDWGVVFSFGTKPAFLALSEHRTVYELRHGSMLAFNLRGQHGSYVKGEGWRLNIVFFSVKETK